MKPLIYVTMILAGLSASATEFGQGEHTRGRSNDGQPGVFVTETHAFGYKKKYLPVNCSNAEFFRDISGGLHPDNRYLLRPKGDLYEETYLMIMRQRGEHHYLTLCEGDSSWINETPKCNLKGCARNAMRPMSEFAVLLGSCANEVRGFLDIKDENGYFLMLGDRIWFKGIATSGGKAGKEIAGSVKGFDKDTCSVTGASYHRTWAPGEENLN